MASNKIVYRSIAMGYGGTLRFDELGTEQDQILFVGTFDCVSCTEVYLPIDPHRCFVAHIDPYVRAGGEVDHDSPQEKFIENTVVQRLQEHAKHHGWSAEDVVRVINTSGMVRKPVIASPYMQKGSVGYPVLQAIKRFLGPDVNLEKYRYPGQTGFVVNHKTGALDLFKFDGGPAETGEQAWKRHEEQYWTVDAVGTTNDWDIDVVNLMNARPS